MAIDDQVMRFTLFFLSTLILVGGVVGFVKAKSKASLIAGIISATLLDLCFAFTFVDPTKAFLAARVVLGILCIVFLVRFVKSRAVVPACLLVLCLAESALLAFGLSAGH